MFVPPRYLTASIALITALLGAAVVLPAAPASAVTATVISEAVSPAVVTNGAVQSVTGQLVTASSRTKLASVTVTIQRRVNGTATWGNWLSTKTSVTGHYKASHRPSRSYNYRARFAGTRTYGPATSATRNGTVRPRVTATLAPSSRSLTVGQLATYTGTVLPRLSTQRVSVQEAVAGKWLNLTSKAPDTAGRYSVAWRPTKAGIHTYRIVVTPGTSALGTGYSANSAITAFRWLWLSDLARVDGRGQSASGSMAVNGTTYPHSVWWIIGGSPSWGEWNLARKCTTFDATVGIADTSASGTAAGFDAYSDDTLVSSRVQRFGTAARVTTPLFGGLRLKLEGIYTGSITRPTWGNARIRCSF